MSHSALASWQVAKPYSLDLRERVWAAWQNGEGSQRELAERFAVSASFVRDLSRRFRASGQVAARAHGGGRQLKADAKTIQRLAALVLKYNDLTYDEYHQRLRGAGGARSLSRAAVGRLLRRLDLTRKKRRSRTMKPTASG